MSCSSSMAVPGLNSLVYYLPTGDKAQSILGEQLSEEETLVCLVFSLGWPPLVTTVLEILS